MPEELVNTWHKNSFNINLIAVSKIETAIF